MRVRDEMDHGLETWNIERSWIILSRDLASTIKSISAASFRTRAFLCCLQLCQQSST